MSRSLSHRGAAGNTQAVVALRQPLGPGAQRDLIHSPDVEVIVDLFVYDFRL